MKINTTYFYLTGRLGRWKYFLKQGNLISHTWDRIKWHVFPKYHITPRFPTHIDIEVSSSCQLKCPMCGQRNMDDSLRGIMDFGLYRKIVDEAVGYGIHTIKLSWRGEPILNPRIWDMVNYAKKKGIKDVAFLSNGEALKIKDIPKMIDSGLDWISFSIDGLGKTYERIRYPSKFNDMVKKLKAIKEEKKRRGKNKPLVRIQSIFSAIKDNPEEYYNFWSPIVDRINFIADKSINAVGGQDFPRDRNFVCPSAWQRMAIAYNGIVAQCIDDYNMQNPLGNVNEKSIYKIWHDKPFKRLRYLQKTKQQDLSPACKECPNRGLTKERIVKIGDRTIKMQELIGQEINMKNINARKLVKKG